MMHSLHRSTQRLAVAALALTLVALPVYGQQPSGAVPAGCSAGNAAPGTRVLVFSRTTGFRHASIPDGIAAIRTLGAARGFVVEATEDPSQFNDRNLQRFNAVVFMSTTGDVLDSTQQAAFERYIRGGGGYVGVHSATDTEYDWPWYGQLVGAYFKRHPQIQDARVDVRDRSFIATKCLPAVWNRRDEWYDFRAAPPADVKILLTLDEKSYQGGTMGDVHPLSWYHRYDGGRAFYTELGHTSESYADPLYLEHLLGGILWAATR
jgi:type 1 glutamine amidotransferase